MSVSSGELPKPRPRMLRTWLHWPRLARQFAPRIDVAELLASRPAEEEVAHWGEYILLDDRVVVLHADGTTTWLMHVLTLPYGDESLAEWDEVVRTYDRRRAGLSFRKALVHLPAGGTRKAQRTAAPLDAHQNAVKFTFAPLRPGVAVELEEQHDEFRPDETGPGLWSQTFLQTLAPCRRRRMVVAIAEPFAAEIKLHHGATEPRESFARGYHLYHWDLENVAGVEADAGTPPPRDFAPWVDISTLRSWQPVARHYFKELAPPRPTPEPIRKLARELAGAAATPREKALALYKYTACDMRYGRHPSELEMPTVRNTSHMLEDLRGDCKDKSALLVAMLGECNIPAQVVVLLTAQNGRAPYLPGRRFDHAIVRAQIENRELWFDPAAGPFIFGELPPNDQGVEGLVIDPERAEIVPIPLEGPAAQMMSRRCQGELAADGTYSFVAAVSSSGERAALARFMLLDRNDDHQRRTVQQSVAEERPGATVEEVRLENIDSVSEPLRYSYRVQLKHWARTVADLLLFRIPWAEKLEFAGPLSAAARFHPLRTPERGRVEETHEIGLPSGYEGYGLPVHIERQCPWLTYACHIEARGRVLVCRRQIDFLGGIVPTDQFAVFKSVWEACARDDELDVVLRK